MAMQGLLDEQSRGQGGSAGRHSAFLRHLHPQLHLPTLMPLPSASEPAPKLARSRSGTGSQGLAARSVSIESAEATPLRHGSAESLSALPASAPEPAPRKSKKLAPAAGVERWSAARVEYARTRSVALRGVGAKRKRGLSAKRELRSRGSSEEGTSGSPPLPAGSKRRRRGEAEAAVDPFLDWQPAAKRAKHGSSTEKSPSPDALSIEDGRAEPGRRTFSSSPGSILHMRHSCIRTDCPVLFAIP